MKLETIKKYSELIEEMTKGNYISLKDFAEQNGINYDTLNAQLSAIRKDVGEYQDLCKEAIDKYDKVQKKWKSPKQELEIPGLQLEAEHFEEEIQDTDDKIESSILRNNAGKIVGYSFRVYRRDKTPVQGILNRDEMQLIYRLYSYYGASITQREVSRHFPDYSLQDFKRILRAFNITKASGPFAPHMYEEKTEDELKEYHLREKENDFLKKIEKDELNDVRKTAVKLARENKELKEQLELTNNISVNLEGFTPSKHVFFDKTDKSIILFLADMHIGARCESYTLYDNPWNKEVLVKRLNNILLNLSNIGPFDEITLCMLGDNLDGMDGQTARRDHIMPQNMDNMEQIETFIEVMVPFIDNLRTMCSKLQIYSVKEGNHDGITAYAASLALKNIVEKNFPDVPFTLYKEFIGEFKLYGHTYLICHGKDSKFMKKPMPLNLDERTKTMIYEWLESKGLTGKDNIHFVKGDLHSNALSSCRLFDYRNVLSLFGASDYSNYNFSRNAHGISYDLFVNNVRTMGTFENI